MKPNDRKPKRTSARRRRSSRANGRKSRGPVTPDGKARSARNAITHGLLANAVVLDTEKSPLFLETLAGLEASLKPANLPASILVQDMAMARWRRLRLAAILKETLDAETAKLTGASTARASEVFRNLADNSRILDLLDRYENRAYLQFMRALRTYHQINQPDPDFCQTNLIPHPDTNPTDPAAQPQPIPRSQATHAPCGEAELAPRAEAEPAPRAEAEPAPRAEAEPAPRGEAEHSPRGEAEHAPRGEAEHAPCGEAEHAPRSEPEHAPCSEAEHVPRGEAEHAPRAEAEHAPRAEAEHVPRAEAEHVPRGEAEHAPRGEAEHAPRGEAEHAPRGEAEHAPRSEAEHVPRGEAEHAPREQSEAPAPHAPPAAYIMFWRESPWAGHVL